MCFLCCLLSIHMLQLLLTGRPISSINSIIIQEAVTLLRKHLKAINMEKGLLFDL